MANSKYENMRESGYDQSGYDPERHQKSGMLDIFVHPDDPNFVRVQGTNYWEKYDPDKHNIDK